MMEHPRGYRPLFSHRDTFMNKSFTLAAGLSALLFALAGKAMGATPQ